jgi:hypothetical protein
VLILGSRKSVNIESLVKSRENTEENQRKTRGKPITRGKTIGKPEENGGLPAMVNIQTTMERSTIL